MTQGLTRKRQARVLALGGSEMDRRAKGSTERPEDVRARHTLATEPSKVRNALYTGVTVG